MTALISSKTLDITILEKSVKLLQQNSRFLNTAFPDFRGINFAELSCISICSAFTPRYTKPLF